MGLWDCNRGYKIGSTRVVEGEEKISRTEELRQVKATHFASLAKSIAYRFK